MLTATKPTQKTVETTHYVVAVIAGQVVQVPKSSVIVSANGALTIPVEEDR